MAKYIIQGETLKAIADEVRDLVDITDEINPNEMIANMEQANADVAAQTEIIEQIRTALDGKAGSNAAEIGVLIDNSGVLDSTEGTVEEKVEQLVDKAEDENGWYKTSELLTNIVGFFASSTLICPPKSNFIKGQSAHIFAQNTAFEYIDYYLDLKSSNVFYRAFFRCRKLKTMVGINTLKGIDMRDMFFDCVELETIQEPLDLSSATNCQYMFHNTPKLTNISFVEETIKVAIEFPSAVLSAESIQSIIDGLATVETAQTLTLNANLKILQSQVDSANAKGWTIAGGTVVSEEEYYG